MSRLAIRSLRRKNLPYGRYGFMVLLRRSSRDIQYAASNAGEVEKLRGLLGTTCRGKSKLLYEVNFRGKRVYTHLLLTEPMDLALVKLVHGDQLHKIYKVVVCPTKSGEPGCDPQSAGGA